MAYCGNFSPTKPSQNVGKATDRISCSFNKKIDCKNEKDIKKMFRLFLSSSNQTNKCHDSANKIHSRPGNGLNNANVILESSTQICSIEETEQGDVTERNDIQPADQDEEGTVYEIQPEKRELDKLRGENWLIENVIFGLNSKEACSIARETQASLLNKYQTLSGKTDEEMFIFKSEIKDFEKSNIIYNRMDTFKEQRDFVEKHKSKLPSDLQIQYYDVVVFYLEKDRDKANALVQHISNLHECLNHPVKAVLYDDTHFDNISRSKLDNLDMTCECSTLIFVFLTKNVELNRLAYKQEEKSSSLKETCTQVDREWNVLFDAVIQKGLETRKLIPVKTEGNLTMPFGTATLAPINYYRNDLNCQLERLISKNIKTRIKKEEDHLIKQFGYLQKI